VEIPVTVCCNSQFYCLFKYYTQMTKWL